MIYKRIFLIFILPLVVSCQFQLPQDWESPTWYLPLTIPLINLNLLVGDFIDSESSSFEIHPVDSTFSVEYFEPMIAPGEIVIDEELFQIDGVDFSLPASESINIPSSDIQQNMVFEQTITIEEIIGQDLSALGGCLPVSFMDDINIPETVIEINPYSSISFDDIEGVNNLNSITIISGTLRNAVENFLPVDISSFDLTMYDDESQVWLENSFNTSLIPLSTGESDSNISNKVVPQLITASILIDVADNTTQNGDLYSTCYLSVDEISGGSIETELQCDLLNESQVDYEIDWVDGPDGLGCYILENGWEIDSNSRITVDISFLLQNQGASLDIDLDLESLETDINESVSVDSQSEMPVELLSVHLENIDDNSANKIKINMENNFMVDVNLEIEFDNLINEDGTPFLIDENIVSGESIDKWLDLSDCTIQNPNGEVIDNLNLVGSIYFPLDQDVIIVTDTDYSIVTNSIFTTPLSFDNVLANVNEFDDIPGIELGDIPAGFSGFEIPTMQFDMIFYNQIDAPLTIELDLVGTSDDGEEISIHVEPEIQFCGTCLVDVEVESESSTDVYSVDISTISITDTVLVVSNQESSTEYILKDKYNTQLTRSIYEVFEKDVVEVNGTAILNGESSLEPGKTTWADLNVIIDPLTLSITENISFISEQTTELSPIDETTSTKIDSGIVSASIELHIENGIPLNSEINLLLSDGNYFPICLDTLITGTIEEQLDYISQLCYESIESVLSPQEVIVDSNDDYDFNTVEFINGSDTTFYGKMFNVPINLPILDELGYVESPAIYTESINLKSGVVRWLTSENEMYITTQINLLASDSQSSGITLRTTDQMDIYAMLTFVMDTEQLSHRENINQKTENYQKDMLK